MPEADYAYADFDEKPDPSHRPLYLQPALKFLGSLPAGSRVLDAGCGGGDFSIGLRAAGFDVYGSDMSKSGIAAARGREVGQFEVASLYDSLTAPFGVPSFHAIVCIEVIEHLYSPKTFAARAFDALEPGGLLIISTPYWGYAKNVVLAVTNRIDRALTALWEGGHIKHFSRATLTELGRQAGFEPVGFQGCSDGLRRYMPPFLWNGVLMAFRKPAG